MQGLCAWRHPWGYFVGAVDGFCATGIKCAKLHLPITAGKGATQ